VTIPNLFRPRGVRTAALTVLVLAGCSPDGAEQSAPETAELNTPPGSAFDWWAGDTPAGHTIIRRDGDGRINMVFLNFLVGDAGDTRQQIRFTTYGNEGGKLDLNSEAVEAFIDLLVDNDITVDPTAAIFDEMMRHVAGQLNPTLAEVADHLPGSLRRGLYTPDFEIGEERMADWAATAVRQGEMVKKLHDSGVQLVAGTDAMAGFALHRELELYAQYGIPNADVLKIATIDAARIVGADDRTGSIEEGKLADLVLLRGNPLEDISAVRRASWVFKGDTAYRPDELYATVGVEPFGWSSAEPGASD
jgi:hypothetical protein